MRGSPALIGGMPFRSKRASDAAVLRQLALALQHMDGHIRLPVDAGGEVLGRAAPGWSSCAE